MDEKSMNPMRSTDEVCGFYDGKPKIRLEVRDLPPEDGVHSAPVLLVETDATGFEFLGNLFLAFARSDEGCHRHLSPDSAGSAYFREGSRLGLLLHRLPCEHPETPIENEGRRLL
jgi:hypothetical protein